MTASARHGSALFISYDGLTDPLGGSQILPYIRSIAAHPRKIHVLSFEKPARYEAAGPQLAEQLVEAGIGWTPLSFSSGGKLAKAWDLARMYAASIRLMKREGFSVIHCRSYQAAQVGCLLKRMFKAKVLFDMRGLWVDERLDGQLWSSEKVLDRLAYRVYKNIERRLLACADHVIALTERVLPELRKLAPRMNAGITVIPCCADFEHFVLPTTEVRNAVRRELGIPSGAFVLSYLGSLGTWYCLDEMLDTFVTAARSRPDIHMLLITRDWKPEHEQRFRERGGQGFESRLHVRAARRDEVPRFLAATDVMMSFIKPAYSKMASSPTKLAEAFACGIPVICNPGIGDVDAQISSLRAGAMLGLEAVTTAADVLACIELAAMNGGAELRARARMHLDLPVAAASYRAVYASLEQV